MTTTPTTKEAPVATTAEAPPVARRYLNPIVADALKTIETEANLPGLVVTEADHTYVTVRIRFDDLDAIATAIRIDADTLHDDCVHVDDHQVTRIEHKEALAELDDANLIIEDARTAIRAAREWGELTETGESRLAAVLDR